MYATGAWLRNSSTRLMSTTCDHTSRRQWMVFWMPSWPRDATVALSISSKNLHFLSRHMYDTKSPRKASYLLHARSSTTSLESHLTTWRNLHTRTPSVQMEAPQPERHRRPASKCQASISGVNLSDIHATESCWTTSVLWSMIVPENRRMTSSAALLRSK